MGAIVGGWQRATTSLSMPALSYGLPYLKAGGISSGCFRRI